MVIVEFKAGKIDWDGKQCTPDKRKGKIVLVPDEADSSIHHLQWLDREKNLEKIDDLVICQDAYLERVEKVSSGRVYVLKYLSSKVRFFFWMQEPRDEKDTQFVEKFNQAVGTKIPPKAVPAARPAVVGGFSSGSDAAAPNAQQQALQDQLLAILRNAQVPGGAAGVPSEKRLQVSLSYILKSDVLLSLAQDTDAMEELKQHLPPQAGELSSDAKTQEILDTFHCPQLKQNMSVLSQAVYSDQLPLLFTALGLQGPPNPSENPMESLCRALEQKHKK